MKTWIGAALVTSVFISLLLSPALAQTKATVRITVMLVDTDLNLKPVPRHALLIKKAGVSEPIRVVTGTDGKTEVAVAPGNYTVESERLVEFQGRSYRWNRSFIVDAPGASVELSVDNAEIEQLGQVGRLSADLPTLFRQWRDSVVTVWGETGHGSGFVIDTRGLILTNQHVVSNFNYAAVQIDETTKVQARIVARSPERDVAILWIAPDRVQAIKPVNLGYTDSGKSVAREGEQVFTIGSPLHQRKVMTTGIVSKVEAHAIISDVNINHGNSGGPLFLTDGRVIGITTFGDFTSQGGPGISGVVRIDEARELIAQAEKTITADAPPDGKLLPVEPVQSFPVEGLKELLQSHPVKSKDYVVNVGDFDVIFVTPVLTHGIRYAEEQANLKEKSKRNQRTSAAPETINPLSELRNWEEYLGAYEPVVALRARPKLVEGFLSAFSRGMAQSQGYVAGPAQMHFKTDFLRMRVYCGQNLVLPIHPGRVEHRLDVSNTAVHVNDATYEGFYTFTPDALGPQCGLVRVELFTEKEPNKPIATAISPKVIQRVWDDFEPFRAVTKNSTSQ